ncbi:MMPL family transporter [Polaribacter sp.]|uniref:MMPL family transporter n=1 Tax=Polaribacter sp. TaxID=1920175 RepID=UPI003EF266B9
MDKIFYNIYQFFFKRKRIAFLLTTLLFSLLIFTASKIKFEEDITKLIPTKNKTSTFQKVLKTVNFADKIIVNISRNEKGSLDDLTKYASQFIDSLTKKSSVYFKDIQGKVDDKEVLKTIDFVYQNLPLFLNSEDYKTIQNRIHKDSIEVLTNKNYNTLISPTGIIAKKTILKDPLGLSFIALNKLKELNVGNQFKLHDGFLVSKDEQHILLFINPKLASSETAENEKFVSQLYSINSLLNRSFKDKVTSEYFGATIIAVANAQRIKKDIQLTVGIAIGVLLIILIFFYRKLTIPIILFIPTLFSGLLAVSVLMLLRGEISAISLGIGSVLLGVTLDYSLHILTHIRGGNSIKNLYKEISSPILMSSLTTTCAFLCLLFLKSEALQDLGIFASISVLSSSIFALLFIPLVYKNSEVKNIKKTSIDTLAKYPFHKKKWSIISIICFVCISLFTYNNVSFNKDLAKLNYTSDALKKAEQQIHTLINISEKSMYLAAYGNTIDNALLVNDGVFKELDLLKKQGKILDFSTIGAFVHSKKNQQEKIKKWQQFWTTNLKQETTENLINSGKKLGFKATSFQPFYTLLNKEFTPIKSDAYRELTALSLDDYITTKNNFTTVTSLLKVENEKADAVRLLFKNKENIVLIDRQYMNELFLGDLKTDFNKLIIYSFLVVLVILYLFYRSFSLTLVTSIPIFLTWLLTVGFMGLLGLEFNIFNIIISTFIFGLGVDYCIFITNGLLLTHSTGEEALPTHKTSIILSVITTILGVGVLIFAKHPALYSISIVSIIGILSAVFVAFTIQPLLFHLFIGSKTKRPIPFLVFIHSIISFTYFGLGGLLLSFFSVTILKIIPVSKKTKMKWFHKVTSKFMKSVLHSTPFLSNRIINTTHEDFKKQAVIIANHSSFLDILAIGKLHPKIIFLVNDWVYNSPIFGKAVQLAGFYPVSSGLENGMSHLKEKVAQGYSLMAFPEGTRSKTHKINRFHKGAFYLAEQFNLDIIPILIHGNSETLSKGTFVIKKGTSTLKILERITNTNTTFGDRYSKRTKNISAYFKKEHHLLRLALEPSNYFHRIVLDEYRYKGNSLYKKVKNDLLTYTETYATILKSIDKKAKITHLSKEDGHLDFLLCLDQPDRKINSFIENLTSINILNNSYLTNSNKNLTFENSIEKVLEKHADVLIINYPLTHNQFAEIIKKEIKLLVLLKESTSLFSDKLIHLGYKISAKDKECILLLK